VKLLKCLKICLSTLNRFNLFLVKFLSCLNLTSWKIWVKSRLAKCIEKSEIQIRIQIFSRNKWIVKLVFVGRRNTAKWSANFLLAKENCKNLSIPLFQFSYKHVATEIKYVCLSLCFSFSIKKNVFHNFHFMILSLFFSNIRMSTYVRSSAQWQYPSVTISYPHEILQ